MSRDRPWLPTALVVTAIALLLAWPVLDAPWVKVVGDPMSPTLDHLWGLWVTAQGLGSHGPYLRDTAGAGFPEGFRALQYEAPNLLLFLPGYLLGGGGASGAALGWNLLQVGAPVAGAVGCWFLGKDLLGRGPALAILAVVFAGSPYLLAHPSMGHSEYLASVLWPWHLWALRRWLRGGTAGWGIGAALSLGLMAATASYLPVFLAFLEPPVALAFAWPRRSWGRMVAVALVAVSMAGVFGWALAQPWPRGHGAFAGQASGAARPAPSLDTLLAGTTRVWPAAAETDLNEQAAYPGLVAVALALIGAVRRGAARGWLVLAVAAFVLGAGSAVALPEGRWLLPAGMLERLIPPLDMVHFWQRIAPLAALPLGVAAAVGAASLIGSGRCAGTLALLLAGLALLDQSTWPRGPVLPAPGTRIDPPPELAEALAELPPGALLQYPLPIVNLPGPPVSTGPYLVWQMSHGRPISTRQDLLGDRTTATSYLSRIVANRQAQRDKQSEVRRAGRDLASLVGAGALNAAEIACARGDAAALRTQGFAGAVLYLRMSKADSVQTLLEQVLGPPGGSGDVRTWALPEPGPPAPPCPLPDPARVVASALLFR